MTINGKTKREFSFSCFRCVKLSKIYPSRELTNMKNTRGFRSCRIQNWMISFSGMHDRYIRLLYKMHTRFTHSFGFGASHANTDMRPQYISNDRDDWYISQRPCISISMHVHLGIALKPVKMEWLRMCMQSKVFTNLPTRNNQCHHRSLNSSQQTSRPAFSWHSSIAFGLLFIGLCVYFIFSSFVCFFFSSSSFDFVWIQIVGIRSLMGSFCLFSVGFSSFLLLFTSMHLAHIATHVHIPHG